MSRDLDLLTEQVLKLTYLSWRSTLPTGWPVTTYYSEFIAELLARLHAMSDWSPVLNTRLIQRVVSAMHPTIPAGLKPRSTAPMYRFRDSSR
jgi:hypothetical protein